MSYVLDALRKAESQRERSAVPNLHARPPGPSAVVGTAGAARPSWRRLAALLTAALVLAGAATLWWTSGRHGAEPAPIVASAKRDPAPPAALPAPSRPPVPAAAIVAPAPPVPPVLRVPSADTRAVASSAAQAPARELRSRPAERSADAARPAAASAAPAAEGRIHQPEELPDDIRRGLPALTVGGAVHSPNPANRILILNGQMFHENDPVAPGLTLEHIALSSAVLRIKGYRYRLKY